MAARNNDASLDSHRSNVLHAWRVLCPRGNDVLSASDLKQFLQAMQCSDQLGMDAESLIPPKGLTVDSLVQILKRNDATFDESEITEKAFGLLDVEGSGFVDAARLRHVLRHAIPGHGLSQLDDGDVAMFMQEMDRDGDGQISLQDFAQIQPRSFQ